MSPDFPYRPSQLSEFENREIIATTLYIIPHDLSISVQQRMRNLSSRLENNARRDQSLQQTPLRSQQRTRRFSRSACHAHPSNRRVVPFSLGPLWILFRVPHIVEFVDTFQNSDFYFLVMEDCTSGDLLRKLTSENRAMEESRCVNEIAIPLLSCLAALHERSYIHRDIKLDNIFLDAKGNVKLGDFGLTIDSNEEKANASVGTVRILAFNASKFQF